MCCNAASQPSKHRCWNRSRVSGPLLTTRFSDTAFAQKRNRDDTRDTGVLVTKEQKPEDPGAKSLCNDAKTNRCNSPGGAASVIWSQTVSSAGAHSAAGPSPKMRGTITERAIASKKYRNSLPIKLTLRYKDIFFPGIIRIGYFFLLDFQSPRPEEATESAELSAFFSFR
ncbi:MAG TPA: hypothetical protein DCX97_01080 [Alistipes sp.]|nr:hypothetical protein [Alistipes sp.]